MSASVDSTAKTAWWMILIRGVLTVAFGVVALASPRIAVLALVYVFASYAFLEGVATISGGIRSRGTSPQWRWSVVQGLISILASLVAWIWLDQMVSVLLYVIAVWAVVLGLAALGEAVAARRKGRRTWAWTSAMGALNIIAGILLLVWPGAGILTLLWLLGSFALASGLVEIGWALRARTAAGAADPLVGDPA